MPTITGTCVPLAPNLLSLLQPPSFHGVQVKHHAALMNPGSMTSVVKAWISTPRLAGVEHSLLLIRADPPSPLHQGGFFTVPNTHAPWHSFQLLKSCAYLRSMGRTCSIYSTKLRIIRTGHLLVKTMSPSRLFLKYGIPLSVTSAASSTKRLKPLSKSTCANADYHPSPHREGFLSLSLSTSYLDRDRPFAIYS